MKNVLVIIFSMLIVSACGTVAGVGKDITSASEWTKEKMK
jgi:predicted small secreted protein